MAAAELGALRRGQGIEGHRRGGAVSPHKVHERAGDGASGPVPVGGGERHQRPVVAGTGQREQVVQDHEGPIGAGGQAATGVAAHVGPVQGQRGIGQREAPQGGGPVGVCGSGPHGGGDVAQVAAMGLLREPEGDLEHEHVPLQVHPLGAAARATLKERGQASVA
ncbi:MAG: hypothetical protein KTR31_17655 [Myxococcales bacterium]|nr:hypothetical protein [Myxococcales bacterium]